MGIKPLKKKKGYILLYTFFIAILSMTVLLLSFKIILDEKKNLYYYESFTLKDDLPQKYKEYNFTYLTEYIQKNISPLDKNNINSCFILYGDKNIFTYEHSYIKYNKDKDCFSLFYYYGENVIKEDDYRYEVINNSVKYSYFNSVYINGRI